MAHENGDDGRVLILRFGDEEVALHLSVEQAERYQRGEPVSYLPDRPYGLAVGSDEQLIEHHHPLPQFEGDGPPLEQDVGEGSYFGEADDDDEP